MDFLKKLSLALCVSVAMLASAPSAMAKPAGKIENATAEETVVAIDETIELSEQTLKAIESDAEKNEIMGLFKATKQRAKQIESTVTYSIREKALGRLGKARLAYKKGKAEKSEVIEKTVKAVDTFKALKNKYHNFSGS